MSIAIEINIDSTRLITNQCLPPPDCIVSKEKIEEKYTIPLQELLSNIASQYNIVNDSVGLHLEVDDIEQLLSDLTDTMTKISKENLPISKFKPT